MTSALTALALILVGALITRSVYRMGLAAGVRLGYGEGRNAAFAEARRLLTERIDELGGDA